MRWVVVSPLRKPDVISDQYKSISDRGVVMTSRLNVRLYIMSAHRIVNSRRRLYIMSAHHVVNSSCSLNITSVVAQPYDFGRAGQTRSFKFSNTHVMYSMAMVARVALAKLGAKDEVYYARGCRDYAYRLVDLFSVMRRANNGVERND